MMARMACRFEGSATEVQLKGVGSVPLTKREAFSAPFAARVNLVGAQVGTDGPHLTLAPVDLLDPVDLSPRGQAYDATYQAGPTLAVTIREGGEEGSLRDPAPGRPKCGREWCPVT